MRYTKEHRENTNRRILEIASRRFRKEGVHAVGIAGLMSDAGLTHGGFYSHFKSKEDLTVRSVAQAVEETLALLSAFAEENNGGLDALISAYLQPAHRDNPEKGCAIAAIGPELSRRPDESQRVISGLIERFFELIGRYLPQDTAPEKRDRIARAVFSLMVGSLQISRMMSDEKARDDVLVDGIAAARFLAEGFSME